jgi:hypothetical protein
LESEAGEGMRSQKDRVFAVELSLSSTAV